jgi:hypothetical protein
MTLQSNLNTDHFDLVTATPANPAAGNALHFPVPDNSRIQLLSGDFTYVSDANVANRLMIVWVVSPLQGVQHGIAKGVQTASETCRYHFTTGISGEDALAAHGKQAAALPDDMIAIIGDEIRIIAHDIQATDQISDIVLRFKQWITE